MNKQKASSLLLLTKDNQLVLQHRDTNPHIYFSGKWGLIGGASNQNETPRSCMLRECYEETSWLPKFLTKLFVINEHCEETVFLSIVDDVSILECREGVELRAFSLLELDTINISRYHRMIINKYINRAHIKHDISKIKVLFYTKILNNSFGGYVTAGQNIYRLLSRFCNTTLITDETLEFLSGNNQGKYDLLFFNGTYENSNAFELLHSICDQVWCYEHNPVRIEYQNEMRKRFLKSDRIIVPSRFLYNLLAPFSINNVTVDPSILPIPINEKTFSFTSFTHHSDIKFCTFCAIKPVRQLEKNILLISALREKGYNCCYHVYGDAPFNGDITYKNRINEMIKFWGLTDYVSLFSPVHSQEDVANIMKQYHFYLDLSDKETYGQAKLEAIFSGLGLIMPRTENNVNLVPANYEFFNDKIDSIIDSMSKRLERFLQFPAEEYTMRNEAHNFAVSKYSDSAVWSIMENMCNGTI